MSSMGFVVLSHRAPEQTARLVRTLARAYDRPAVAVHHDFSQHPFPDALEGDAGFVRPHRRTSWGDVSLVDAVVDGIEQLARRPDPPAWIHVMSGADYPLRPHDELVAAIAASGASAFMELTEVVEDRSRTDFGFASPRRHMDLALPMPRRVRDLRYAGPVGHALRKAQLRHDAFGASRSLWRDGRRCYAGSQWFSVDIATARNIVDVRRDDRRLARHFRDGLIPDESYVQTIVGNLAGARVETDNRRFIRWPGEDGIEPPPDHQPHQHRWWTKRQFWDFRASVLSHPVTITEAMLPEVLASECFFARKFDPAVDARVLDLLDGHLGIA